MTRATIMGPIGLVLAMLVSTPRPLATGGASSGPGQLRNPLPGAVLTQPFGCTALELEPIAPQCPAGHLHAGLDLAAPTGTPIVAAADGLAGTSFDMGGYGLHVVLAHGRGMTSLYGHMSTLEITAGAFVAAGQPIGRVGSTGLSTGPHLHFEVRRDGRPVDPAPLIGRNP